MLKMYWNRANSHLAIPMALFEKIALLTILLKLFGLDNWLYIAAALTILVFGFILLGWLDIKYKIYEMEMSVNNKHNPELMRIHRRVKK